MKRLMTLLAAFGLGAVVASIGWGVYTFKRQSELAIYYVSMLHGHAKVGEQMLTYLETPDPQIARRLAFAASNSVALFPGDIVAWDKEFPLIQFKERYSTECDRLEKFMRDRLARAATNTIATNPE